MTRFQECHIEHIPREENVNADALSKYASSEIESYAGTVYYEVFKTLTIDIRLVAPISQSYAGTVYYEVFKTPTIDIRLVAPISHGTCWMDPIKSHLETGWLPNDAMESMKLSVRALRYALIDGILYKKSFLIHT